MRFISITTSLEIWGLGSWNLCSAGYTLYFKLKCNNLPRGIYFISSCELRVKTGSYETSG